MKAIKYTKNGLVITVGIRNTAEETAAEMAEDIAGGGYEVVEVEAPKESAEEKRLRELEGAVMANQDWILDKELKEALGDLEV